MTSNIESPKHSEESSRLDPRHYHLWRDWAFNLQLGHTELNDTPESYLFGHSLHTIGQGLVAELREGRLKDGEPFLILLDEKTDQEVIIESPKADLENAFLKSVFKNIRGWVSGETDEERGFYPTSALALGSAIFGLPPKLVKEMILKEIGEKADNPYHANLKEALDKVNESNLEKLLNYMLFSQTQLTNNEAYFLQTGLKEPPPFGSSPIVIDGETFEFSGQDFGGIALEEKDEEFLKPLLESSRKGRNKMISEAKELAAKVFSKDKEKIGNPPSWWVNNENSEGFSSKQVLVYAPYGENEAKNLPKFFTEIYKSSSGRGGWFIIEVERPTNGPWLMAGPVSRLVS